jgi:hypothetical protein
VARGDLHVAQADAGVEHGGHKRMASVRRGRVRMTRCGYWRGLATVTRSHP